MEMERALRVLEFTKIRDQLASYALTDLGKEACLTLAPYPDYSQVVHALDETEEATVLLTYLGGHPLIAFPDVREQITLAQKGACLSQRALLEKYEYNAYYHLFDRNEESDAFYRLPEDIAG